MKAQAGPASSSGMGRGVSECVRSAHLVGSLTASLSNSDDRGAYVGDVRKSEHYGGKKS